jgi:thioredoxin-dependent peroxiredoxin
VMIHRTIFLVLVLTMSACQTHQMETRPMETRTNITSSRGKPLTLEGRGVEVGQPAPDFTAVDTSVQERRLSEFRGKTVVLTTFPSIDTSLCAVQVRSFNQRAADLPGEIVVIAMSMDLPFAQRRWCGAEGVERVIPLSDYKHHDFARNWGLRMRESGLLARATYVIDPQGIIRYEEIVPDTSQEPNYDAALSAARQAAG